MTTATTDAWGRQDLLACSVAEWFDQRVAPLVSWDPEDEEPSAPPTWVPAERLPDDDELEAVTARGRREHGTPARVALSALVGDLAGHSAQVAAAGVLRDGVLVRVAEPGVLQRRRHAGGWTCGARLHRGRVTVVDGHPWDGRPGVDTVPDAAALEAELVAEVVRAGTPSVDLVARRARRSRPVLWDVVADSLAWSADSLLRASPALPAGPVLGALRRLLGAPGAPWRRQPAVWVASSAAGPCPVVHRGSCCLWYQCEPPTDGPADAQDDPAWIARFGRDDVRYCATCRFRDRTDVEARVVFQHERAAPSA